MDYKTAFNHFYLTVVLLTFLSCVGGLPEGVENAISKIPDHIDYNFHVKPILSDRCFACHGPDAQKREAELRLDLPESSYASLASGSGKAISPGNRFRSQLVKRILNQDEELMMPPPSSNLSLTDRERAILIKWIDQGAEYKPHWAIIKPKKEEIPHHAGQEWALNEIDHFIAQKLENEKIGPSPEADKEHLIRRVFFDLTGLPPSLKELDFWLENNRPDYYSILVDTLLDSPAFGERMAAHWLDVSRFADSEGYLDDFHHAMWPWRDWLISAFNENLPYDQFILWQIGGDQIPDATLEQKLATAFNRHHKQNSEGGLIPEEFRIEYVADRTNTVGTAFLGLTLGCARCHDHKYDPISQKEYYQLFSFFNSVVERGDGIFGYNAIENGQMIPNVLSMNAGPVLALSDTRIDSIRNYILSEIKANEDILVGMAANNADHFRDWQSRAQVADLEQAIMRATTSHLTFDGMKEGTDIDKVKGNKAPRFAGKIGAVKGVKGLAIRSDAEGQYIADGSKSSFERSDPFSISFWIQTPRVFYDAHVIYNGNNRIQGYRGWDIVLDSNRIHFRLNHAHPFQSIDISIPSPIPTNEWIHFVWTYDGSSQAEGMKLYQNGERINPRVNRDYIYRSSKPYTDDRATVYMPYKGIIIGNRHYDKDFTGGLLDEVHILNKEADALVALFLHDEDRAKEVFKEALQRSDSSLKPFYDLYVDTRLEQARNKLQSLRLSEVETIDTVREIMIMGDLPEARATHILDRGLYDAPGDRIARGVPNTIFPWPDTLPLNRYGLGRWLTHPDHPLTGRVAVNQIWYLMFGQGIVETVEDFGNQGAIPTHPELLDWLAVDFQENGWDLKRLIRQIVTSATYRQSSVFRRELKETDPENRLLARSPRYRRSAEMIRDNILASSELLIDKLGGPSVFPYQPPGLWKEAMTHAFFPEYQIDYNNGLYRRSIYTFWKRLMPPPGMLVFDASTRAECQVRRQRSNTPLQALVLLNDPQFIEGCRKLAANMWLSNNGDKRQALNNIFRVLTSRLPTEKEQDILYDQLEAEYNYFQNNTPDRDTYLDIGAWRVAANIPKSDLAALTRVTNTILNSTEAYYKN